MPIDVPQSNPSQNQLDKAQRCVVAQYLDDKYEIWDPMVDSRHWVTLDPDSCDCIGFRHYPTCSHITAAKLHVERQKTDKTAEELISEIWDF
jgi:hypothetical protein